MSFFLFLLYIVDTGSRSDGRLLILVDVSQMERCHWCSHSLCTIHHRAMRHPIGTHLVWSSTVLLAVAVHTFSTMATASVLASSSSSFAAFVGPHQRGRGASLFLLLNGPDDDINDDDITDENDNNNNNNIMVASSDLVRCRARVAYDGALFGGFQLQNNKRTVQVCHVMCVDCYTLPTLSHW